jgi:Cd2+/Zn2+-exporting ATPase
MNSSAPLKEQIYVIQKMDCPTEEKLIRNRLEGMAGIEDMRFNLMQRELTVQYSLESDAAIFDALNDLSMEPARKGEEPVDAEQHASTASLRTKIMVAVSGVCAMSAEAASWFGSDDKSAIVMVLAAIAIITGGIETAKKGWLALKTFTLNINALMMIAITGAVFIGEWPEAAMVVFLFALAELIEAYSLDRARNAIRNLMEMTPETAMVQTASGWKEMKAEDVALTSIVRVKPGERIPLDGKITEGSSSVNQAPITGESMPVEKKPGDPVFAGTINERGSFEFEVTANKGNTTLARIVRSVQEAQSERAPTQRFVDQFSRYYTPAIVVIAILLAAIPPLFFGQEFMPWLYKALVMLVIACPCALVISTPVTVVSGLAAAARRGILVKGGAYLEEGRKLKALALDKTGTLTQGKPEVTDIKPVTSMKENTALQIAASLDSHSEHPVAHAIVKRWEGELLEVKEFEAITGRGVKGIVNGKRYYIGNHRLIEELSICGPELEAVLEALEKEGKTVVVLTTENEPLCVFAVADVIRESSVEAIAALQAAGVHCIILTGDNQTTANAIAAKVGIEDVRGNMLPEDKLDVIGKLREQYKVVGMVGDGVNDAPALAKSSIGFAMGAAGTDTALETADVALMEDDLRRLPLFLALSRKTGAVLKQNITLAIDIKAVFLALNLAGEATLWMAVFADMGASLIVVANGLRLLKFTK